MWVNKDETIAKIVAATFPGYNGKKFRIETRERVNCASCCDGGSREYFRFYNLATGEVTQELPAQSAFDKRFQWIIDVPLPPGVGCVKHSIFCGKDAGITIEVRPDNTAPLLRRSRQTLTQLPGSLQTSDRGPVCEPGAGGERNRRKSSGKEAAKMATIYDYTNGEVITEGLQGSSACDEALQAARWIARDRHKTVVLEDDGELLIVGPRGGVRRMSGAEARDGGWAEQAEPAAD